MNLWLILPILIPLLTAIAALLAWRWRHAQRWISTIGAAGLLAAAIGLILSVSEDGIQAAQMGNWSAPFGITLVADLFSAIMVVLAGLMGLAVAIYSLASMDEERERFGYYPLLHILLMGVCGAFLTGDMFNLYVWFEVMLVTSFVLLALGCEKAQLEGAVKYVTLNLISSALFLAAVGMLYGAAGTLNMADLAIGAARPHHDAGDSVPDRVRHQGRGLPALLLAARIVSHAARGGVGYLRRAAHQGGRVRPHPRLHAAVRAGHRLHPHADPCHRRDDDDHGRARRGGAGPVPSHPVVPHR